MANGPPRIEPNIRRSALFGVVLSLSLHLGAATYVGGQKAPEFAFEFEIPMEIELGMSTEMSFSGQAEESAEPPVEAEAVEGAANEGAIAADAGVADAGRDGGVDAGDAGHDAADAGVDSGVDSGVDTGVDTGAEDAGEELSGDENEGPAQRIPPGAQIAFRMDMPSIRASRLAPQVSQLLTDIPDWRLLLEGSGIDPMSDLDRLLIATPNLRRQNFVMAGRHAHPEQGRAFIDATVQRMHEARGVEVRWRRQDGVDVVDWPNIDRTARVLAVVGPRHFVIARARDLPRVLAIAQTRQEREAAQAEEAEEGETPALSGSAADALISMGENQAVSLEIEGIHRFVVRARQRNPDIPAPDVRVLPERISMGLRDTGSAALLEGSAYYPDDETAAEGLVFFRDELAARRAAAPGFVRGFFDALSLSQEEDTLAIRYEATYITATLGFGFARGWLRERREARGASTMRGAASAMGSAMGMGASSMGMGVSAMTGGEGASMEGGSSMRSVESVMEAPSPSSAATMAP